MTDGPLLQDDKARRIWEGFRQSMKLAKSDERDFDAIVTFSKAAHLLDDEQASINLVDMISEHAIEVCGLKPDDVQAQIAEGARRADDEQSRRSNGRAARNGHNGYTVEQALPPTSPDDYGIVSTRTGIAERAPAKKQREDWRTNAITAAELQIKRFKEVTFVVPDLIPSDGITLVCAKPKAGKSWLLLHIAIAALTDATTLGDRPVLQGDVLFLALEDSERRLQYRCDKLLGTFARWPDGLTFRTQWARIDQGGCDDIRAWVDERRAAGRPIAFVAIDVLAKVRAPPKSGQTPYAADYEAIGILQQLALELAVPIVVIHHTRKADAEDLMDKVSGTYGIVGAADTVIVIDKRTHGLVIDVRGRDVESNTFAADFDDKQTCRWSIKGDAGAVYRSELQRCVLAVLTEANAPMAVSDIRTAVQQDPQFSRLTPGALKQTLKRMADDGVIVRTKRGEYALPPT